MNNANNMLTVWIPVIVAVIAAVSGWVPLLLQRRKLAAEARKAEREADKAGGEADKSLADSANIITTAASGSVALLERAYKSQLDELQRVVADLNARYGELHRANIELSARLREANDRIARLETLYAEAKRTEDALRAELSRALRQNSDYLCRINELVRTVEALVAQMKKAGAVPAVDLSVLDRIRSMAGVNGEWDTDGRRSGDAPDDTDTAPSSEDADGARDGGRQDE
jgi:DNA repair exonuclease SbcCD ATPase subunit